MGASARTRPIRRAVVIVLDGAGAGALPDAARFGDEGASTLANTAAAAGGLALPWLGLLGLGNIADLPGVPPRRRTLGSHGLLAERGPAKDTMAGHWELMGHTASRPFPLYPDGFPPEVIAAFESAVGRRVLGNRPASGTGILDLLGPEHLRTGRPIVYTSADSVFQIAAHTEVVPLERMYEWCRTARSILSGAHGVGRVIARPFTGRPGAFERLHARRRDYSLPPPGPTLLDRARDAGLEVWGVGKIEDIFAGRGLSRSVHTRDDADGLRRVLGLMADLERGILLVNLVDLDTRWGHRNDPLGFARGLEAIDARVPRLLNALREDDVLVFTADHGCDPTTASTDHTREQVPLLVTGHRLRSGVDLGRRSSFADLAATLAELLGIPGTGEGTSFAPVLLRGVRTLLTQAPGRTVPT